MFIVRFLVFVVGVGLVIASLRSAIRTFVLPRSVNDALTRYVFRVMRSTFNLWTSRARSYADRDKVMAYFAPITLLALLPAWLILILVGYTGIYWAMGTDSLSAAFTLSGSSLLTLGFAQPLDMLTTVVVFSESTLGLIMVALLIAYLPTMYTAFSKRENAVTMLEVRAGAPPSAFEMILRYHRIHGLDRLNDVWLTWENWFADIEESHTSLAALAFFRSPQPDHSWVTAAGAILDAASLVNAVVDIEHDPQADLCIRAGYLALRRISDFFRIPYNATPTKDDPISVSHDEFGAVCEQLAKGGVPLKPDREAAWVAFRGWRVNYDTVLLALAALTMAPYAPWSSDRSLLPRRTRKFNQR
jgi:hypothetical protein